MVQTDDQKNMKLISQGAEALLYRTTIYSKRLPCIVKERTVKRYRHAALDETLTLKRMRAEARQLLHCRELGLPVPAVLFIDAKRRQLWLEDAGENSMTLGKWFHSVLTNNELSLNTVNSRVRKMCESLGDLLAKLHANHVIHGDLTTANIIVKKEEPNSHPDLFLIDFGLAGGVACGASQRLVEEKAVDLYVFERALTSSLDRPTNVIETLPASNGDSDSLELPTPEMIVDKCFQRYSKIYPDEAVKCQLPTPGEKRVREGQDKEKLRSNREQAVHSILKHLDAVRLRGRKRDCVG